jgi:hypothetical protein
MKSLIRVFADGYIKIRSPSPTLLAAMTGNGGLFAPEQIEREVAKHLIMDEATTLEFQQGWEAFLDRRRGTAEELVARNLIEGASYGGLTENDALARIWAQNPRSNVVSTHEVEQEIVNNPQLEERRGFRDAWIWSGTAIDVDMPKARVIHMDRIRKVRNAEFERRGLDRHLQTALTRGDTVRAQELEEEKQILRDIPQKYDLSGFKTPEELKAAWPKELDKRIKEVKKAL